MRLLPCGREGLLVELGSLAEVATVHDVLWRHRDDGELPGVVDVVPAARTVLVTVDDAARLDAVRDVLARVGGSASPTAGADVEDRDPAVVELAVHYDGEDLRMVADDAGIDPADVVALHTGADYTVAFGGFAPGFAYLTGLPEPLCQPRLDSPRTRIPSGAVGVAGEFSGVYPRASPGGWRLIGRLGDDAPTLFDPDRDPPALLVPGTRVRFRDADGAGGDAG